MQPLPNIAFVMTKLTLLPGISNDLVKNQFKVTKPIEYVFTSDTQSSFFGNNITIQTIVGENGAGKSTLIDIMIRMCNNVGSILYMSLQHLRYEPLRYVLGIYADLEYHIFGVKGILKCRDRVILLEYGEKKYALCVDAKMAHAGYELYNSRNERQVKEIASHFFYTIITNYSIQAYISDDYRDDKCITYDSKTRMWIENHGGTWIDSLFHKNDGYMCPVNLNPFRDSGVIDMNTEVELTRNRIAALLVYLEKQKARYEQENDGTHPQRSFELIDGYSLCDIEYEPYRYKVLKWFDNISSDETEAQKSERIISKFKEAYRKKNSPAKIILENFCLQSDKDSDDEMLWYGRLYLVIKVLSIASKYPAYSRYRAIGNVRLAIADDVGDKPKRLFKNLAREVKNDDSHIGIKIAQTRRFLHQYKQVEDANRFTLQFTFDDYERWTHLDNDRNSLTDIQRRMPPPFFKSKIILKKSAATKIEGFDENSGDEAIHAKGDERRVPFTRLSSGERQLLFTASAVIYHIINLKSIDEGRVKYRGINVVFDEAELCFHPEYQRTFICKFLRMVKAVDIPSDCSLNIIITTHSPFLLSDMPQNHILYLKNGIPYHPKGRETSINPFAANVCDILQNSFFLDKGFMGAYAQKKINALIEFLTSDDGTRASYDMTLAGKLINMIGDPLLKSYLERMQSQFKKKYPHALEKQMSDTERLAQLEAEAAALREKISHEKDFD